MYARHPAVCRRSSRIRLYPVEFLAGQMAPVVRRSDRQPRRQVHQAAADDLSFGAFRQGFSLYHRKPGGRQAYRVRDSRFDGARRRHQRRRGQSDAGNYTLCQRQVDGAGERSADLCWRQCFRTAGAAARPVESRAAGGHLRRQREKGQQRGGDLRPGRQRLQYFHAPTPPVSMVPCGV